MPRRKAVKRVVRKEEGWLGRRLIYI